MFRHQEYGLDWELDDDPKKGQLGLLRENHYKMLFAPGQRDRSFQPTDRWLDIGANIGAFALRAASAGVTEVVAVEPESECYSQLKRNAELNGFLDTTEALGRIVPLEAGVTISGTRFLELALSNSYSSTHRVGRIRGRKSITVAGIDVNETIESYKINKIKMDCEGGEAEILEGMNADSWHQIDELVFEYHFSFLKDHNWSRFNRILRIIEEAGLTIIKQPATK